MRIPAPSPDTKPSRSLSKGRLAPWGSSLRVDIAFMALNPPMPSSVMVASAPPAMMASARPAAMCSAASPREWAPVEQADTWERFPYLVPKAMLICPGARLMMVSGMKKGLMRPGPFSMRVR